jgi:hypothetical protein
MYLVGARFDELSAAEAALSELRGRVALEEGGLGLRPLGSLRYEAPADGLVVAGRFRHDDVDAVVEILEHHGGDIVFKRAEWRLPRPHLTSSDREGGGGGWVSRLRR